MKINLAGTLQRFARQRTSITLPDTNAGKILALLAQQEPQLAAALLEEQGTLKPYVQLYINQQALDQLPSDHLIRDTDEVILLSSLVGG
ncbi:MAG: MoaD/ThiS family protein [Legionellaceae bacterium]|nr:MoaD/ThiS family protein [Legionellaceae bacterium]